MQTQSERHKQKIAQFRFRELVLVVFRFRAPVSLYSFDGAGFDGHTLNSENSRAWLIQSETFITHLIVFLQSQPKVVEGRSKARGEMRQVCLILFQGPLTVQQYWWSFEQIHSQNSVNGNNARLLWDHINMKRKIIRNFLPLAYNLIFPSYRGCSLKWKVPY